MPRILSNLLLAATVMATMALIPRLRPAHSVDETKSPRVLVGRSQNVKHAYREWVRPYERDGGSRNLVVPLGWSKGLSVRHTRATGSARFDLAAGNVTVESRYVPPDVSDVWLVDNQPLPDDSVHPEPHDKYRYLGRLERRGESARLAVGLGSAAFRDFDVDLVVLALDGVPPETGGVLFGSPTLFQRLHRREERSRAGLPATADRLLNTGGPPTGLFTRALDAVSLPIVWANEPGDDGGDSPADHDEDQLVARGRSLFFEETFRGNGRTCGTCHPAENNLTIDAAFIASRPASDPLFVAEFNPALAVGFENPRLMRTAALILENLDGFDQPGVMRSVPHTLALSTSLAPAAFDGSTVPPLQRTGWGGDGAPGSGSLREFAIGAVTQHFTRTMNRAPGRDFRLPNDEQLDAMEAFQLSLGRQADLDLEQMSFRSEAVSLGRRIFNNDGTDPTVAAGKCQACHANAGANAGEVNANFDTGVRNLPGTPAANDPPDAGFGTVPHAEGGFGDGRFNTPPLIEAADTPPFFHNSAVDTIEEAVNFYNSASFNDSPSGQFNGGIQLTPDEVAAVGAMLRVLNAVENVRQAVEEAGRANTANNVHRSAVHLRQAIEETEDALNVLPGTLHPVAARRLQAALDLERAALDEPNKNRRRPLVEQATVKLAEARADMIE